MPGQEEDNLRKTIKAERERPWGKNEWGCAALMVTPLLVFIILGVSQINQPGREQASAPKPTAQAKQRMKANDGQVLFNGYEYEATEAISVFREPNLTESLYATIKTGSTFRCIATHEDVNPFYPGGKELWFKVIFEAGGQARGGWVMHHSP